MRYFQFFAATLFATLASSLFAQTTELRFAVNTSQPVAQEDTLYLAGNVATLGNWNPSGFSLTRKSNTSFEGIVKLEIGEVIEYTSISDGESNRKRGGNAEPFAKWIAEKLKPQIDREYRTQANRDSTWIGGSSLGGKEGTTENAARGNVERFERLQKTFTTIVQKQNSNLIVGGRLFPEAKHNESAWRERYEFSAINAHKSGGA